MSEVKSFNVTSRELAAFAIAMTLVGGAVWAFVPYFVNASLAPLELRLPVPVAHAVGFFACGLLMFPVWQVFQRSYPNGRRWSLWRYTMILIGVAILSMSVEGVIRSQL